MKRPLKYIPQLALRGLSASLAVCALFGFNPQTLAATYTRQNTAGDISLGANWTAGTGGTPGNAPGASDVGLFNNTITAAGQIDTIGTSMTVGELQVTNPAGAITINGPGTLTIDGLGGTGIDLSAATQNLTITAPITLGAASQTWLVGSGRTITIGGTTAAGGIGQAATGDGLTIQGLGTVLLTGSTGTTSTYTGATVVNGAKLELESDSAGGPTSYLSPSTSLTVAGGYFLLQSVSGQAALLQTLNGVTINPGYSTIQDSRGAGAGLTLGTITRNGVGGVVFFNATNGSNGASNFIHASNTASTLIGGWALYAINAGTATQSPFGFAYEGTGGVVQQAATTNDTWGTGNNTLVTAASDSVSAGANTQTLTFGPVGLATASTITLGGVSQITSGGILLTGTVANFNETITGGTLEGSTGGDLIVNNFSGTNGTSGSLSINSVIANAGSATALTKTGDGPLVLGGNNTFTGGVYLDEGEIRLNNAGALNSTTPNFVTFTNGNATTVVSQILSLNGQSVTISGLNTSAVVGTGSAIPVVRNATSGTTVSAATLTVNNSGANTFAGNLQDGAGGGTLALTKTGAGTLTLSGPSNTYTGNTTVSNGSLVFTASLPSSSLFSVAGGSTLDVSGVSAGLSLGSSATLSTAAASAQIAAINGLVTLNGGTLITGATGSTMQFGSLALNSGNLSFSISTGAAVSGNVGSGTSSLVNVTATNGLNLGSGTSGADVINLSGGAFTSADSYSLVYDLFNYSGTLNGNLSDLSIGTGKVNGLTYTFGSGTAGEVTLTISGTPLFIGNWITDASTGSWANATNWDVNAVPNASSATVNLGGAAASANQLARTVTLDGNQTVGILNFASPDGESYTIDAGTSGAQTLTFDNTFISAPATIAVSSGTHSIDSTVAVNLTSNLAVSVASASQLTIAGAIANTNTGTLAATLTKTGAGTLILSGANSYGPSSGTVGTNLNGGTLQVGNNSSLGSGNLSFGSAATLKSGASSLTLGNNISIGSGLTATVDTAGNTFTLSGIISGATGALTVASSTLWGTLFLTNAETYGGGTSINAGATLQIDNGGAVGALPTTGAIADGGSLVFDRSDSSTIVVGNAISGGGSVTQEGATGNIIQLNTANSYSGGTNITSGKIQLGNAAGIGTGDLTVSSGASLDLDAKSPTIGALNGAGAIDSSAAGTITVSIGNNNDSGTFTGTLKNTNGTVSLTKNGTGSQLLTGANTYSGNTIINNGSLTIGGSSDLTGNVDVSASVGNASLIVENSAIIDSTGQLQVSDLNDATQNSANLTVMNSASVTAASFVFGNDGKPGNSTVTVQDSASLIINGNFDLNFIAGTTAQTNTVNANGGTLAVNSFIKSSTGGTHNDVINLNGGVIEALASDTSPSVVFLPATAGTTVDVDANGAIFNTNGFNDTVAAALVHGAGTPDGGLTKEGAGTLYLTAANSFNGGAIIDAGTLNINGEFALGGAAYGGLTFNGGTLQYVTGFTGNGTGDITENSAVTPVAENVTLASSATIDTNGNNVVYAKTFGNAGAGSLTVADSAGGGSLTLDAAATYTGATTINPGATLKLGDGTIGHDGTIASSSVTDNGNLIYNRYGTNSTTLAINGSGNVTVSGPGSQTLSTSSGYTGSTTVAAGGTLIVGGGLTGTTTVTDGGVLEADAAINSSAAISVTGVLSGNGGSVGPITSTGGTLKPGDTIGSTAAGSLAAAGNVSLDPASTFSIRLGVQTETDNDVLNVSGGTFLLDDSNLVVNVGSSADDATLADVGDLYVIVNGGAGATGSGTDVFTDVNTSGAVPTYTSSSGFTFDVLYGVTPTGGNNFTTGGNDIALELVSVPEPGTWASMLGGLGILLVWQKNRRRRPAM